VLLFVIASITKLAKLAGLVIEADIGNSTALIVFKTSSLSGIRPQGHQAGKPGRREWL
jgi:hypothetical protein